MCVNASALFPQGVEAKESGQRSKCPKEVLPTPSVLEKFGDAGVLLPQASKGPATKAWRNLPGIEGISRVVA